MDELMRQMENSNKMNALSLSQNVLGKHLHFHAKRPPLQEIHIEHLKTQMQHLIVLREYHLLKMRLTDHRELRENYRSIADSISGVISQYSDLLAKLNSK